MQVRDNGSDRRVEPCEHGYPYGSGVRIVFGADDRAGACAVPPGRRDALYLLRGLFTGISLMLAPAGFVAEAPGLPLPEGVFPELGGILIEAREHAVRMVEEDLRVEEARAEGAVYSARRYPSVIGFGRYVSRLEERPDFDRARTGLYPQAGITGRQRLFDWGASEASARIGEIRVAMAEKNREEVYRLLVLEIRSAFLDLAVGQVAIEVAEGRRDLAARERATAEMRFAREEITEEALREARLAVESAELRLERARREHSDAIDRLRRLTGIGESGDDWVPRTIPEFAAVGEAPEISIGWRPGLEVSAARVRQAERQAELERVRNRPRVDLVAGVVQDQVAVFDREDIDRTIFFTGIEVTWNVFDGFESRGRHGAALARRRLEERRHDRETREWLASVERLRGAVELGAREVRLAGESLELAGIRLSEREADFAAGRISATAVAVARVAYAETNLDALRSRAEYLMAVAEYLSETGADPVLKTIPRNRESLGLD